MANLREVMRLAGRGAAVVAVAGAATGALVVASVLPVPEVGAEPPSTVVQPAESRQLRVCPGPLLSLAEDAAAATTARSFGAPTVAVAADPADAVIEQAVLEAPDDASASEGVGPIAISSEPGAVLAGMLAGAQAQAVDDESLSGLTAAACAEPAAESWLLAGATDVGRSALLMLANPGEVASTVDVRVTGGSGAVEAPAGLGIIVQPGMQRVIPLAGLAPNVQTLVVHVTSTGAPVAAAIEHSVVLGLEPAGIELSTPVAPPAQRQVIPGFVVTDARGGSGDGDHADGDDLPALRLYAPGGDETSVAVEVRDASGEPVRQVDVTLAAGQPTDLPIGSIPAGTYVVVVEAGAPVVAAARSTVVSGGDDPILTDLSWAVATRALLDRAAVAVPDGPAPSLQLANPAPEDVEATVTIGGSDRTVLVPAGGAASVRLTGGAEVMLDGVAGLHASVTYRGDDRLAAFPVLPPGPLDSPVRVFPQ